MTPNFRESLEHRWQRTLDELARAGRLRSLASPRGLDFSSNDYLGYAQQRWTNAELSQSGAASRLLRGHVDLWDEVEISLARWHGAASALMFSSGFAANEGLLSTIISKTDWVASDWFNHASIIDGLRLTKAERYVYIHRDLACLERGLRKAIADRPADRELFIVTESLFSMDGDRAPLRELVDLAERYGAHLIVDEAHATGCLGPTGSGLVDELGLRNRVLATVHTGGKALGVIGGYVVGSKLLKETLVNRSRSFIFSTALPPIIADWWKQSIVKTQTDDEGRRRLQERTREFRQELASLGVDVPAGDYIVPIVLGEDPVAVNAANALADAGFDIRAIRPPTVPEGTARLRVSIHASHETSDVLAAARAIERAVRDAKA